MGRPAHHRSAAVAGMLALALASGPAGCGPGASPAASTAAKVSQAETTHEYASPPPASQTVADPAMDPVQAVRSFASVYINWTAGTVAAHMRALAAQSVGQARSVVELAAAQTARDYELQQGGIANSGTVEAIAPLRGAVNRYVVVTRELTRASNTDAYQGLRPAWHLAIADVVALTPAGWAVSRWQPES